MFNTFFFCEPSFTDRAAAVVCKNLVLGILCIFRYARCRGLLLCTKMNSLASWMISHFSVGSAGRLFWFYAIYFVWNIGNKIHIDDIHTGAMTLHMTLCIGQ